MKFKRSEKEPPSVSETTKQGGEARRQQFWPPAERAVWTDRMLEALVMGVKGGKWFSLMDKVYSRRNLEAAWKQVKRNRGAAGNDHISISKFQAEESKYLDNLGAELTSGSYQPRPVKRVMIPKPGTTERRPLGIPTVRDRIAQAAVRNVIEPIFEHRFHEHSYGFRPGRSCKDALRRVNDLLRQGYLWVVDADINSYFDTIDHDILMEEVRKVVADGRVLSLLRAFLEQDIMDGVAQWTPLRGSPQGAVISPLLANIHLHPIDLALAASGIEFVRYADDLVLLCKSETAAMNALELLQGLMQKRKLTLHPDKTRVVDALNDPKGFDFLGYTFRKGHKWPRAKSFMRLKNRIRELTRRSGGKSLRNVVDVINPVLRGWFEYFKHAGKTYFPRIDQWVRMRLRSILRFQQGREGRGRGADHQRWPNAFFAKYGLFTMTEARAAILSSPK